jgi:hypothetical protein
LNADRRTAPAAERNLPAILAVLKRHAPLTGQALEIASGSGQQIVQFAAQHPALTWQASDRDARNLASITAWAQFAPAANMRPPLVLDAATPGWGKRQAGCALVVIVNLLHLISAPAAQVVLAETAMALAEGGRLCLYGPFLRDGQTISPGDAQFDADLRAQDPEIGYKDLAWVRATLQSHGMVASVEEMPANNLMLIAFKN